MALLARRLRAERLDEILLFLGRCIGTKQQSDLQSFIWIDGADCARVLAFAALASRKDDVVAAFGHGASGVKQF